MDRRGFLAGAGAAGSILVAGCTGDGGGGATPTEGDTPTATPEASPTPASAQETYPDYEWGKLEDAEPVGTSSITMSGFTFDPLIAAVTPGSEVTVTNEDSTQHTVTAPRLGIDEGVGGGASTSFTVETEGTYDYVCTFHPPGMLGRLVVTTSTPTEGGTDGTPTPTPTPTDGGVDY